MTDEIAVTTAPPYPEARGESRKVERASPPANRAASRRPATTTREEGCELTVVECARLLALIGARDGWLPSDDHVAAWHPVGCDAISYEDAVNRVLEHRPGHRVSIACLVGNCDPRGPHTIPAEEQCDQVRFVIETRRWRQEMHELYGVIEPLTERSYRLMVKVNGAEYLKPFLAAIVAGA